MIGKYYQYIDNTLWSKASLRTQHTLTILVRGRRLIITNGHWIVLTCTLDFIISESLPNEAVGVLWTGASWEYISNVLTMDSERIINLLFRFDFLHLSHLPLTPAIFFASVLFGYNTLVRH